MVRSIRPLFYYFQKSLLRDLQLLFHFPVSLSFTVFDKPVSLRSPFSLKPVSYSFTFGDKPITCSFTVYKNR